MTATYLDQVHVRHDGLDLPNDLCLGGSVNLLQLDGKDGLLLGLLLNWCLSGSRGGSTSSGCGRRSGHGDFGDVESSLKEDTCQLDLLRRVSRRFHSGYAVPGSCPKLLQTVHMTRSLPLSSPPLSEAGPPLAFRSQRRAIAAPYIRRCNPISALPPTVLPPTIQHVPTLTFNAVTNSETSNNVNPEMESTIVASFGDNGCSGVDGCSSRATRDTCSDRMATGAKVDRVDRQLEMSSEDGSIKPAYELMS